MDRYYCCLQTLGLFCPSSMPEIVIRARFVIPDRFYSRFVWIHDIIWASCFFCVLFCKQFLGYFKTERSRSSWLFFNYPRFLCRGKQVTVNLIHVRSDKLSETICELDIRYMYFKLCMRGHQFKDLRSKHVA